MLTKRIIPCLDIDQGRVVKGIQFQNLSDAGDPVRLGKFYCEKGADELAFLDITASVEGRNTMLSLVEKIAQEVFIPFTVGGGIRTVDDIKKTLRAGADKVSLNSITIKSPEIITEAANIYGSQCIVVAIDVKKINGAWKVFINGGRINTGLSAIEWGQKVAAYGAGEILLTSMDADGTKKGFDIELTNFFSQKLSIPIIASGGAGNLVDFYNIFTKGNADGALAASIFHYGSYSISEVKKYLRTKNIQIRN